MRRGLLAVVVVALVICVAEADAQTGVPSGVVVRDGDGALWLTSNGARVRVPIYPVAPEQVAAIPPTDRWLVPNADGALTLGDQPDWASSAPAQPIELAGASDQNTRPFTLTTGTYTARWSAGLQPRQTSCFVGAKLKRVEDQSTAAGIMSAMLSQQGAPSRSGETQLYGIKGGQYYLATETTGCDWSVTLTASL